MTDTVGVDVVAISTHSRSEVLMAAFTNFYR
jgi:hypothetical protein